MRRRSFITLLGGMAANALSLGIWSLPLRAQSRIHRVGILFLAGETPGFRKLADALRQLGYFEDRNIAYVVRSAGTHVERLPELAREVVAEKPDVIVSAAAIAARALTDATQDIPIVMALVGDPVVLGFTSSMARPTANVTGFTTGHDTLAAKRLELLLELVPTAHTVAFLWVPTNVQSQLVEERTRQAAATLKVDLMSLPVATPEEISLAIERAENGRAAALLIAPDPLIVRNRQTIIDECLLRGLPAMHSYSFEVRDGALISYGSDVGEDYERAAVYVDRNLKRREGRRLAIPGADAHRADHQFAHRSLDRANSSRFADGARRRGDRIGWATSGPGTFETSTDVRYTAVFAGTSGHEDLRPGPPRSKMIPTADIRVAFDPRESTPKCHTLHENEFRTLTRNTRASSMHTFRCAGRV